MDQQSSRSREEILNYSGNDAIDSKNNMSLDEKLRKERLHRKTMFLKKKKKPSYLSARQNRSYQAQQDELNGIEPQVTNAHWLIQFFQGISIKKILLPRTTLQDLYLKTIDDNDEFKHDEQCIPIMYKLKKNEILAWRVKIKDSQHLEYISTSENDVLSLIHKERKKENKRARELEFIRKSNPSHAYIISNKEILKSQRSTKREMTMNFSRQKKYRRHHFPILQHSHQRSKTIKIKLLTMIENRNFVRVLDTSRSRQNSQFNYKSLNSHSLRANESSRQNSQKIILNGIEYDYEELRNMIQRPLGKENDEIPDDSIMEDRYIEYRINEAKQNFALKNNWSAEDILTDHFGLQRKVLIFKSLNRIDKLIWINGISGVFQVLQKYIIMTMRYKIVEIFFDFCILTNIIVLILDAELPQTVSSAFNNIITVFLGIELLMKLIAQNIRKYLSKKVNIIECLIVLSCLSEFIVGQLLNNNSIPDGIKLFLHIIRGLKAVLFYRIIKYNTFAVRMAFITEKTFPLFCNLIVLMFFIIVMFAFLGIELFKGKFPQNDQLGQLHSYDDLQKAWFSTFLIGTNDDWYGVLVLGTTYGDTWITILYQTLLLYVLNFMTFGLFIAIILDGFAKYLSRDEDELQHYYDPFHINTEISENVKEILEIGGTLNSNNSQQSNSDELDLYENHHQQQNDPDNEEPNQMRIKTNSQIASQLMEIEESKGKEFDIQISIDQIAKALLKEFIYYENVECEDSIFLFNKDNVFRRFCYGLVMDYWYQIFINLTLLLSLINMAVSTYYDHDQTLQNPIMLYVIGILELILNAIVFCDGVLKIISFGLCLQKGSFTSELWRTLDFIYVSKFLLNQFVQTDFLSVLNYFKQKFFMKDRYIRPMRFLNLNQGVKEVKDALAESLPDLINVLVVQTLVWLIFAIFGVILYQGKLGYCDNSMNFGVSKAACVEEGKVWHVFVHNFENILQAISSLYIICTLDLWGPIFQICFNSATEQTGPLPFANQWGTYIFFFLFILIGAFFFLGFFTGILFIYFQENRAKLMNAELTEDQILFLKISDKIMVEQPQYSDPPISFIRVTASKIIAHSIYQKAFTPLLFLNTLVLALFYHEQSYEYFRTLNKLHHIFASVLIFDTILKLTAYGFVRFFGLGWRKFEFTLSLMAFADLILDETLHWSDLYYTQTVNSQLFIPLRLLFFVRDFRILLIIQQFQGISRLMRILAFSMPYLIKILSLFMSILLIYAYAGCQLFGRINKGEIMDEYLNFSNLFLAMLTLFKCSTRNNWRHIMVDCSNLNEYCHTDANQCGQPLYIAQIYFYSFVFISSLIVFQLFVLALVEQLESISLLIYKGFYNSQNNVIQTYIENIDKFRTIWCQYSYETKGKKMHTKSLAHFLLQLGEPLGSMKGDNIWDVAKSAANFHIKSDAQGYVHFKEVLYETIRHVYREEVFKSGSIEGIRQMKMHDKNIRFRLHHQRLVLLNILLFLYNLLFLSYDMLSKYIKPIQYLQQIKYHYMNRAFVTKELLFNERLFYQLIQKAISQKQQGLIFTDSVDVSFHDKDDNASDSSNEEDTRREIIYLDILSTKHDLSDNNDQPEEILIENYNQRKNPHKKQKVRLQFNEQVDQTQIDDDLIFEPLQISTQNRIVPESTTNIKIKKSNLKQNFNFDRRRSNFQTLNPDGTSLMVMNVGEQFQSFGSAMNSYTIPMKPFNPIPNPMADQNESESDISKVIDAEYSVNQVIEEEGDIRSINNSYLQITARPLFDEDISLNSDYDRVKSETYHQSNKLKQYNLQNIKKQINKPREFNTKSSNRPQNFSQFK